MIRSVGEVLQKMYDSEINIRMSWEWDAGVKWETDIHFGECFGGSDVAETVESAIEGLAEYICEMYPGSEFEKWWRSDNDLSA